MLNITLSTKDGYSDTFLTSGSLTIVGHDAFISVDNPTKTYATGYKASGVPEVTLVGFTVSAHRQDPKPVINVGDQVTIDDKVYELVNVRNARYIGNGDLELVPVR